MLVAVIVAIIVLLVAVAIVVALLVLRSRRQGDKVSAGRDRVKSVANVGISSFSR